MTAVLVGIAGLSFRLKAGGGLYMIAAVRGVIDVDDELQVIG